MKVQTTDYSQNCQGLWAWVREGWGGYFLQIIFRCLLGTTSITYMYRYLHINQFFINVIGEKKLKQNIILIYTKVHIFKLNLHVKLIFRINFLKILCSLECPRCLKIKIKKKGKVNGNQVPELVKLQSMEQIL